MATRESEIETVCAGCGTRHVVFRTLRATAGVAVAKEVERYPCAACGALLFAEDVGDNAHVLVLRTDDPAAAQIRSDRRRARRRRADPFARVGRWVRRVERPSTPTLVASALFAALLAWGVARWGWIVLLFAPVAGVVGFVVLAFVMMKYHEVRMRRRR